MITLPPPPPPDFRLTWREDLAEYRVSKPNVGDTDVYTAATVLAYGESCAQAGNTSVRVSDIGQDFFYKKAYLEWIEKTNFIQDWFDSGKLSGKYLGMHRADIIYDLLKYFCGR